MNEPWLEQQCLYNRKRKKLASSLVFLPNMETSIREGRGFQGLVQSVFDAELKSPSQQYAGKSWVHNYPCNRFAIGQIVRWEADSRSFSGDRCLKSFVTSTDFGCSQRLSFGVKWMCYESFRAKVRNRKICSIGLPRGLETWGNKYWFISDLRVDSIKDTNYFLNVDIKNDNVWMSFQFRETCGHLLSCVLVVPVGILFHLFGVKVLSFNTFLVSSALWMVVSWKLYQAYHSLPKGHGTQLLGLNETDSSTFALYDVLRVESAADIADLAKANREIEQELRKLLQEEAIASTDFVVLGLLCPADGFVATRKLLAKQNRRNATIVLQLERGEVFYSKFEWQHKRIGRGGRDESFHPIIKVQSVGSVLRWKSSTHGPTQLDSDSDPGDRTGTATSDSWEGKTSDSGFSRSKNRTMGSGEGSKFQSPSSAIDDANIVSMGGFESQVNVHLMERYSRLGKIGFDNAMLRRAAGTNLVYLLDLLVRLSNRFNFGDEEYSELILLLAQGVSGNEIRFFKACRRLTSNQFEAELLSVAKKREYPNISKTTKGLILMKIVANLFLAHYEVLTDPSSVPEEKLLFSDLPLKSLELKPNLQSGLIEGEEVEQKDRADRETLKGDSQQNRKDLKEGNKDHLKLLGSDRKKLNNTKPADSEKGWLALKDPIT